jgi:hypothetical protein
MHIRKVTLENIRSIDFFEMEFDKPAGWHVLIGDNGAGKSSILRSIALGLIGPSDAQALRLPLINWIQKDKDYCSIKLNIQRDEADGYSGQKRPLVKPFDASVKISRDVNSGFEIGKIERNGNGGTNPQDYIWSGKGGWFSAAFGPFRRFTGGEKEWMKVYYSNPRAASHLSIFGEDVALTESIEWLQKIKFEEYESNAISSNILQSIKKFINEGDLLPHNAKLMDVSSSGVVFKDGNEYEIDVTQMSDGFRSLLSMLFELIRQLVRVYGNEAVFRSIWNSDNENMHIDVPGVVLIDEVDAHLHPTWQTRIGQWFTKHFPGIQFIVTSHSPLVCRACENGTIWRLAAPGSELKSGKVIDEDKNILINGNVLDAYGTALFGENVTIGIEAVKRKEKLAMLGNKKRRMSKLEPTEESELNQLKLMFPGNDTINL